MTTTAALLFALASPAFFSASDHIDGIPSSADPQTDLTDLYAFATPGRENNATVVVNVYPGVGPQGHFSDAVHYRILVRQVKVTPDARSLFSTVESSQLAIDCSFAIPHHHDGGRESDRVTCELASPRTQETVTGAVGRVVDGATRMYAGRRLDPFFLSIPSFQGIRLRRGFKASSGEKPQRKNGLDTASVLTVAIEIDLPRFFGATDGLFAVAAESIRSADGVVIDRVGRPEMVNLSLHRYRPKDLAVKEYYNQEIRTFTPADSISRVVFGRLKGNIEQYDRLHSGRDWTDAGLDRFVNVLLEDFLVLDVDAPCSASHDDYFEIERSYLSGKGTHGTCGGRRLADNVLSTIYGLYLAGLDSSPAAFRDGVNRPPKITAEFPYMTEAPAKMKLKTRIVLDVLQRQQDGKPSWRDRRYGTSSRGGRCDGDPE